MVCMYGVRCDDYCSNVCRTMMLEPNEQLEQTYELLLAAEQALINALRPGQAIADAYQAAIDVVTEKQPALLPKMPKSFGLLLLLLL